MAGLTEQQSRKQARKMDQGPEPTLYESGKGVELEEPEAMTAPYKNVIGDQEQWVWENESGEQAHGLNLSCQAECSGDLNHNLCTENKNNNKNVKEDAPSSSATPAPETATKLLVTKSIEFKTQNDNNIKQYHTRGPKRGLMVMFAYSNFQTGPEDRDIESDCQMMEEVFSEFNFRVDTYRNLCKKKTLEAMKSLSPAGYECVFIVVSSRGHGRRGQWDTEFCCSDGRLIPVYEVVDIFNNVNYPELEGVPKVFIFQMCRGPKSLSGHDYPTDSPAGTVVEGGEQGAGAARVERVSSDVLIAHSTLPGFEDVSNIGGAADSLYVQALCEVFAAHAHAHHVSDLFRLLDAELQRTTVLENWGFGNLYLHPGLVGARDAPSSSATPAPETATKLRVTKSIEFKTQNDNRIKQYRTRGPKRGLMHIYGYSEFQTGPEDRDIESDYKMMEEVFSDLSFDVVIHRNLCKEKTLESMKNLSPAGYDCVFIVVSSHGYERKGKWDTEFCCTNGGLIPVYEVVDIFNNVNYPELEGVPKVFIFQMCRGPKSLSGHNYATDNLARTVVEREQRAGAARDKRLSDVLIAHSTLPGYEHVRNNSGAAGSLYVQALCKVFAEDAHAHHVGHLFKLLNVELPRTTVFEEWDFGYLYLHPGLVEDADGNPTEMQ